MSVLPYFVFVYRDNSIRFASNIGMSGSEPTKLHTHPDMFVVKYLKKYGLSLQDTNHYEIIDTRKL